MWSRSLSLFARSSSCSMSDGISMTHIQSGPRLEEIRALFLEYARGLNFNLCFQNFDNELAGLPGPYAAPRGRLILCEVNGVTAGCIALKPLEAGACEMKRLYVRPEFRGRKLGARLAQHIIGAAQSIGYSV